MKLREELRKELIISSPSHLFFFSLINNFLINKIVSFTNEYIILKNDVSIKTPLVGYDEIVKVFALLLIMGINQLPTYKDYFSGVDWCNNKYASLLFTRDRFMFILRNLHFNEPGSDKLTFLKSYLNKKFYNLGRNFDSNNFMIDESLISFSGRLSFKQY